MTIAAAVPLAVDLSNGSVNTSHNVLCKAPLKHRDLSFTVFFLYISTFLLLYEQKDYS